MLIIAIPAIIVFSFIFATVVQNVQEAVNPDLTADSWATEEHFNVFYSAATVVTNFWMYMIPIALIGLAYWAWIYTQRKGVN